MDLLDNFVTIVNNFLYGMLLIAMLLVCGLFFSVSTRFVQFRYFFEIFKVIFEKKSDMNGVSSFQALMVSTASRVGTGNIVGVSAAICMGGYGAVPWMWLIAVLGMASAFAETVESINESFSAVDEQISEISRNLDLKQDALTNAQLSAISSVSSIKGTVLVGDSNIRTTSAEEGSNIKWTLELTAQPVVTDTTLSGYSGIVATKDSTVSSQWNVGLAQGYVEAITAVSSIETITKSDVDEIWAIVTGERV